MAAPAYLSHFAITDLTAQASSPTTSARLPAPDAARRRRLRPRARRLVDGRPRRARPAARPAWTAMRSTCQLARASRRRSTSANGYISFGAAGDSYYYSRTRLARPGHDHGSHGGRRAGRPARPGSTTSGATSSASRAAAGTGTASNSTTDARSCSSMCAAPRAAGHPVRLGRSMRPAATDILPEEIEIEPTGQLGQPALRGDLRERLGDTAAEAGARPGTSGRSSPTKNWIPAPRPAYSTGRARWR